MNSKLNRVDGILLVDKPAGWTSHDVVAKVRSILRQSASQQSLVTSDSRLDTRGSKIRVGHTGTLDPAATGLLVLVVGRHTKRAAEFSKLDKTYECELTLGATSTTADSEGKITEIDAPAPSEKEIEAVLKTFIGEIEQVPPAFSAIKIGGQRAYKLARQGKAVKIEPRKVTIYSIKNIAYDYPKLSFTAAVSSGTYIRSLAEDIGQKLGTGAYLSSLRRIKVGSFDISQANNLDKLTINDIIAL